MSLKIEWDKMDASIASQLKDYLNSHLELMPTPDFLGALSIEELDFGSDPPHIEIVNICDASPEFAVDSDNISSNEKSAPSFYDTDPISQTHELPRYDASTLHPWDSASMVGFDHGSNRQEKIILEEISKEEIRRIQKNPNTVRCNLDRSDDPRSKSADLSPNVSTTETKPLFGALIDQLQLELLIKYNGNMFIKIRTELIVNQPTPKFMALPLSLTLTRFSFHALALIAVIGHDIKFCFRNPEDQPSDVDAIKSPRKTFLESIQIETEIGDCNKQVLRNVKKIESFIVEQIRHLVGSVLTFPSFYTMNLSGNSDGEMESDSQSDTVSID